MELYQILLLAFVGCAYASCDRNLIPDLSLKLRGTDIAFPCDSTKNIYTSTGRYIPQNILITRMQIYKDKAIVAIPRNKKGIPITLGQISLKCKSCKPAILPYTCWALQEEGNCKALQSVVDLFIDPLDIVWVLDTGIVHTLEQPLKRCNPKVVAISAKTGQILNIIDLSSFASPSSRLQYIVADYSPEGNAFVYIADASGVIIVYDVFAGKGHRVVLPKAVSAGGSKDVLYMILIKKPCGNLVYFTYLSGSNLFYIKAANLQKGQANGAVVDVGPKPNGAKIVPLGTDNASAMILRYKSESDIFIWNTETCFNPDNFLLVQRGGDCRQSVQVTAGYKKLMWSIDANINDYIAGTTGCLGPNMAIHPLVKT